jgi:hypothetical protein
MAIPLNFFILFICSEVGGRLRSALVTAVRTSAAPNLEDWTVTAARLLFTDSGGGSTMALPGPATQCGGGGQSGKININNKLILKTEITEIMWVLYGYL